MEIKFAYYFTVIYVNLVACDSEKPCRIEHSVDISDGVFNADDETYRKDGILYRPPNYFLEGQIVRGCICQIKTCVRKCCAYDEYLNADSKNCTYYTDPPEFLMHLPADKSTTTSFHIINGMLQCGDRKRSVLQPDSNPSDSFSITHDGFVSYASLVFKQEDYCLEYISSRSLSAIFCVPDVKHGAPFLFKAGMICNKRYVKVDKKYISR